LIQIILLQSCWKTLSLAPDFRISFPLPFRYGCRPESCRFGARLARSHHLTWSFPSPLNPRNLTFAMMSVTLICGSKTFLLNWTICRTYQGMSCPGITSIKYCIVLKEILCLNKDFTLPLPSTFVSTRLPVPFPACSCRVFTLHFVRYLLAGRLVLFSITIWALQFLVRHVRTVYHFPST